MSLHNNIYRLMNEYESAKSQFKETGVFPEGLKPTINEIRDSYYEYAKRLDAENYYVKISKGAPQWPDCLWWGLRDKRVAPSFQKGVYIAYLLNDKTKVLYLTLIQAVTEAAFYGHEEKIEFTGPARANNPDVLERLIEGSKEIRKQFGNKYEELVITVDSGRASYDAGVVFAKDYPLESLPNDELLWSDFNLFVDIYKQYFQLFCKRANSEEDASFIQELNENFEPARTRFSYKGMKRPVESPVNRKQGKVYPRKREVSQNALSRADYCCEYDPSHPTFIRKKSDTQYTEPHHLIPMEYQNLFDYSLDVEENVVSLCSNCHNQIHYDRDAEAIITSLYMQRKELLESVGLKVSLETLLSFYK